MSAERARVLAGLHGAASALAYAARALRDSPDLHCRPVESVPDAAAWLEALARDTRAALLLAEQGDPTGARCADDELLDCLADGGLALALDRHR